MYVYEYCFGDAVGEFVLVGLHEDKVLIYSLTGKRFYQALAPVVETCKPLRDDPGVTTQDLIDAYERWREWTDECEIAEDDTGHRSLMDACKHFYETKWKLSENSEDIQESNKEC